MATKSRFYDAFSSLSLILFNSHDIIFEISPRLYLSTDICTKTPWSGDNKHFLLGMFHIAPRKHDGRKRHFIFFVLVFFPISEFILKLSLSGPIYSDAFLGISCLSFSVYFFIFCFPVNIKVLNNATTLVE